MALKEGLQDKLPIKAGKIKQRERFFHYFVIDAAGESLVQQRTGKDIWQELYQFPLLEHTALLPLESETIPSFLDELLGKGNWQVSAQKGPYQQKLTHQKINALFVEVKVLGKLNTTDSRYKSTVREKLNNFAFPKVIDCYLTDNRLYLSLT